MPFLNHLRLDEWKIPGEWVVVEPLYYEDTTGKIHETPRGLISDLASIPTVAQILPGFSVNGKSRRPAVNHDYNYCAQEISRKEADEMLRVSLIEEGLSEEVARIYWLAVRAFGWSHWKKRKGGLIPAYDFVPADYDFGSN